MGIHNTNSNTSVDTICIPSLDKRHNYIDNIKSNNSVQLASVNTIIPYINSNTANIITVLILFWVKVLSLLLLLLQKIQNITN